MAIVITGATIWDGVHEEALTDHILWVKGECIAEILPASQFRVPEGDTIIDAAGKFVVPGLLNANVHLLGDARLEVLARYHDRFTDLIVEAAQVALRNGLTSVFDTWGPRRFLVEARDRIASGEVQGSRIFCGGNILGFDGPFSPDFYPKALDVASPAFAKRMNAIWAENVGRHLMWLEPHAIAREVERYIAGGVDFIKYAGNDHFPGAFLAFSPDAQKAIVDVANAAGLTAQAHTMSVEGVRIAIEAGCALLQHANITGPVPIPETTLRLFAERGTGAVVFPITERGFQAIEQHLSPEVRTSWFSAYENARNLVAAGANVLLANDGGLFAQELESDPAHSKLASQLASPEGGGMYCLANGHFSWMEAMESLGCTPMQILRGATINIARAYGRHMDIGSLAKGRRADLLILDKDPRAAAKHYRTIHLVMKAGRVVDREALPAPRLLTAPGETAPEEAELVPFIKTLGAPGCGLCRH